PITRKVCASCRGSNGPARMALRRPSTLLACPGHDRGSSRSRQVLHHPRRRSRMISLTPLLAFLQNAATPTPAPSQHAAGGEAALVLPDLNRATLLGRSGRRLPLLRGPRSGGAALLRGLAH